MAVVNASGTLTFAGQAVANETVVIGDQTYTWKASVSTTANEVLIGGTIAASAQNLFDAINLTGTPGTQYGSLTTKHKQVRASAVTSTTVVVQSKIGGTVGNLINSTETMTQGSFGGAVLAGGTGDQVEDLRVLLQSSGAQIAADLQQALREIVFDPATV